MWGGGGEGEVGWMGGWGGVGGGRLQLPADQEVGIGEQVCSREGMGLGGGELRMGDQQSKFVSPFFIARISFIRTLKIFSVF